MRIVIAPDSFKGTAAAHEAAQAIADGWQSVRPDDDLDLLPQADGGEGTLDAIAAAVPDARAHRIAVTGPDGRPVDATWLELPDGTAVVELAQSSGLPQMARLDALGATTRGLGETLAAALDAGAARLVIALGGSATTDGAAGALEVLGLTLRGDAGRPLPPGGGALVDLETVDRSALRPAPRGGVTLLTDVTNPLLGPTGAAAVFGPQKGATPADVAHLERGLVRFAELLGGDPTRPGTGAAGGAGYGLATAWDADIRPGAAEIARLTGLVDAAARADVVLLGEGRFDATSLQGKVVGHALGLAGPTTRAIVIAGAVDTHVDGIETISLTDLAGSPDAARSDALRWLTTAGAEAATRSR